MLRLGDVRTAYSDGNHNAFTDLVRFQSRIYLCFRSSTVGHGAGEPAEVVVLSSSDDGRTWLPCHRFGVARRDPRDPHFLVFRGRLWVYTGCWLCPEGDRGEAPHHPPPHSARTRLSRPCLVAPPGSRGPRMG